MFLGLISLGVYCSSLLNLQPIAVNQFQKSHLLHETSLGMVYIPSHLPRPGWTSCPSDLSPFLHAHCPGFRSGQLSLHLDYSIVLLVGLSMLCISLSLT